MFNYLAKGKPKFTIECKPHPGSLPSATYNAPPEESQPQESPCSNVNQKPNIEKQRKKDSSEDEGDANVVKKIKALKKVEQNLQKELEAR